jgi:hypothetical protein
VRVSWDVLATGPESGKFRKGDDSGYGEKVKGGREGGEFLEEEGGRKRIGRVVNILMAVAPPTPGVFVKE